MFRNYLNSKNSKTSDKLSSLNLIYFKSNNNKKKNLQISQNNNLSFFKNEYEQNNLLNSIKSFSSDKSREKRNSNLISKNFLFKNYTIGKTLINKNINNNKTNAIINLKNCLYISRNKNKNIMKTFHSKSIPLSITQSKLNGKDLINNKFNVLSFKTNIIENKKIYISNLKVHKNKYQNEKIQEIIKNSKLKSNSLDKSDKNKNKDTNSYRIDFKKGLFSPINLKKSFNYNQDFMKKSKNKHF